MRSTTLASAALLAARPLVAAQVDEASTFAVAARADDEYWRKVCYPADFTETQVPPCFSIDNIEAACQPNGTSPLAHAAHAQCMCGGSFFREWAGCQSCLFVHGQRSELEMAHYRDIMTAASRELCTGTPTAPWASLFSQAQATVTAPVTGATTLRDVKSGDTAVSLYYTATGSQGPGPITGSATGATGTAPVPTATFVRGTTTSDNAGVPTATTATTRSPSSDSDSDSTTGTEAASSGPTGSGKPDTNAAAPAGTAGDMGLWLAVVGVALAAAL